MNEYPPSEIGRMMVWRGHGVTKVEVSHTDGRPGQQATDEVLSGIGCLLEHPQVWWHLDPTVYGITLAAQEDARRRAHQDALEVEVDAYRDGFERAHRAIAAAAQVPDESPLRVQLDYALTAAVMRGRTAAEDREVLGRSWSAAVRAARAAHRHQAAREALVTDMAIAPREQERFMASVRMDARYTFVRPWGTLAVHGTEAGPVYSVTRRRGASWLKTSLITWLPWTPAAGHRVEPGSPLEYLLTLESHGRDAGLLAQLIRGGWRWDQLDRPEVAELVELAGSEQDAGLAPSLLTRPGEVAAEAVELVEAAAHALALAGRLGTQEVAVEVPALVRECSTTEDMRAAIVQLTQLGDDLARLAQVEQAHHAEVEAPMIEARERESREAARHAREAATARAVASLESSRAAVRLTTKAHQAAMKTTSNTHPED